MSWRALDWSEIHLMLSELSGLGNEKLLRPQGAQGGQERLRTGMPPRVLAAWGSDRYKVVRKDVANLALDSLSLLHLRDTWKVMPLELRSYRFWAWLRALNGKDHRMRKQEGWGQNVYNLGAGRRGASQDIEQDRGNRTEQNRKAPRRMGSTMGIIQCHMKDCAVRSGNGPAEKPRQVYELKTPTGLLLAGETSGSGFSPLRQGPVRVNSQVFGCPCAGTTFPYSTIWICK